MRRNLIMFGIVALVLCFGLVFVTGCSKKSVVKDEAAVSQPKAVESKAKQDAADEEARLRALREKEAREKAEREKALWEKAERERLKKEAEAAAAAKKLAEKEAAREKKTAPAAELGDINFDFDKYNLRPGDREILKGHAEWLMKNPDYAVAIEGHCDERGTAEYNMALGQRRAESAKKFLLESGVADQRIKTISYGKELPLDSGHNEEAWAKNRRCHFILTPMKK